MSKKIFELAKELNMGPLDLVEELKGNGFSVRNHMTVLSDEDLEAALKLFEEKQEVKKVVKKKTVRKKTVKKATKKSTTAKKTTTKEASSAKKAKKKKTVKQNTVIRRRVSETSTAKVEEDTDKISLEEALNSNPEESREVAEVTVQVDEAGVPIKADDSENGVGLRVVSRPEELQEEDSEQTQESGEVQAEQSEAKAQESKPEKKTGHRFTPVYIPSRDSKAKPAETKPKTEEGETKKETDDKSDATSKKRLGGLASMISAKGKKIVSRSRELTFARAEDELKTYSTLNMYGRPIYTATRKKKAYSGPSSQTLITEVKESKRIIQVHKGIFAGDFAQKLSVKFNDFADKVLELNLLVREDDYIGLELTKEIADVYGYKVDDRAFKEEEVIEKKEFSDSEKDNLPSRNPIITIMGHVDHGKTTLLDFLRKSKVAQREDGGITQHIGAYSVEAKNKKLTFLDTPGHAAFGSMRERGANVTDIVVLVVAADDGVMPQTKESIRYCQQAGVTIVVAINKMDKEGVNPDRVKQELAEFEITPEDWGGEHQFVAISALKGTGVDDLLDAIALQAEMMELRADDKGKAEGIVVESRIETGRGPVATVLVQSGTLKKGDSVVVGECYGRARNLMDDSGSSINKATPSMPVQILGLDKAPSPGDILNVVKNEREAKKVVNNRINERKVLESSTLDDKVSLEDFFSTEVSDSGEKKTLNLIVRSDVQGSYEAIKQSLEAVNNREVEVKVIGGGVGPINDNDVILASSSRGFIIGFNMRPMTSARKMSEEKGIDVKTYSVIYELIDDVRLAAEGLLEPEVVEKFIGRAEVRETFTVPKAGLIAGSMVIDGAIKDGCNIRLLRHSKIVFDGKMSSLRRFKDDVKEVKNGYECGIGLENFNDIKVGDIFEAYIFEKKLRKLKDVESEEVESAVQNGES